MEHILLTYAYGVFILLFDIFILISFTRTLKFESWVELEPIFQKDWTISRYKILKLQGQSKIGRKLKYLEHNSVFIHQTHYKKGVTINLVIIKKVSTREYPI